MVTMNKLSTARRVAVVAALVDGCSIRATVRMTGVSKNTISKLLVELGSACTKYQDGTLRNLRCKRLQCNEIRSFVGGKDKNLPSEKKEAGLGSAWTWTAIDADTKLIPSWLVGSRDTESAYEFMQGRGGPSARSRTAHDRRPQALSGGR